MYRLACTNSHVQIYSCCACSDSRGGATPHTPAAAAAAAAAAADSRMNLIHLKTGAWWCDATVLLMYYERVWFDEIENLQSINSSAFYLYAQLVLTEGSGAVL